MIYSKDNIRYWINKLLKIDNNYLNRIEILKNSNKAVFDGMTYSLNLYNKKIFLRNLSSDFNVYKQIFEYKEYDFANELFEKYYGSIPKILIDAGANIGLTSIYFSNLHPDLKILAIEPEENNYLQLLKNIKYYYNIKPLQKAIWNRNTKLKIRNDFRDRQSWSFQVDASSGTQEVDADTLEAILKEQDINEIDILKVDVEGAEKQIFLEDKTINKILLKTKIICLEIHDSEVSRIEISSKIMQLGFNLFAKGETLFAVKASE